ncbi:MAG TPA: M48 family metalloprotease [Steroidobacteraceae bacterium]|jgi:Zn-dependent protease with chaperone function/Tfp pilus assembly protein PilE|nr:M48 family metalloprotease [Steroidobacteraceae bacterium]
MKEHVYPRDRTLTIVSMVIGVLIWGGVAAAVSLSGAAALIGVAVTVPVAALLSFIAYLFAKSAAIAHLRGNAIEVTQHQLPDIFSQLRTCCKALGMSRLPTMYVQNGNGVMNAFATWFLGRQFVILLSGVVDAMETNPNGVRFYIGHELGHVLRHDNPLVGFLRWPALRLPLLGAAFSRARESSCDLHGLACSQSPETATRSLAALSAGARSWANVSLDGYRRQVAAAKGFWMSFHELLASYPWTAKRAIRLLDKNPDIPGRNPFAYLLALFVPYAGRMGAGLGMLIYVYFIGVLAAVAIPAYQDYTIRAVLTGAAAESQLARQQLVQYYLAKNALPNSLSEAGVDEQLPNGVRLSLNPKGMVLTVHSHRGELVFTPKKDPQGQINWVCKGGEGTKPQQLPTACR